MMKPWQEKIKALSKTVVGSTKVPLERDTTRETNLGNFITDAMVYHVSLLAKIFTSTG